MTLRERVARELAALDDALCFDGVPNRLSLWRCDRYRSHADAIIPIVLAEAAKVAMEKGNQWHKEWRAGHKSSSHIEGKSDGADEIASAIEALA